MPFLVTSLAYTDIDDSYFQKLIENEEKFRIYLGCIVDKNSCDDFGNHVKGMFYFTFIILIG